MLYSEQMKEICDKLGVDRSECKDGLYSTFLQAISDACDNTGGGGTIKNQNKTITANGTYKADSGYTGLGTVNVSVEPALQEKTVVANGTVLPDANYDGLSKVVVNVPSSGIVPSGTLNITANGNYDVTNYAGASVNVAASGGGGDSEWEETLISVIERTATDPVLPSGLTSIGEYAFYTNKNLALTSLPSGLTSIDTYAFYSCAKLALTSLPSGLTSIGSNAFYGCTGLEEITFNGTPSSIGNNSFSGCTNLTTINVPWAEGEVKNAPWGATNATINYNYTEG